MSKAKIKLPAPGLSSRAFQLKKWQHLLSAAQTTVRANKQNMQGHGEEGCWPERDPGSGGSRWVRKGLQPIRQDSGSF